MVASIRIDRLRRYLTIGQAARELRVSPEWLARLTDRGEIAAVETALGRLYDPAAVAALAETRREGRS